VNIDGGLIEFLIPITILIASVYNIFTADVKKHKKRFVLALSTLFFGLIHGFGFAREFKMFAGRSENKLELLIEFALGIEIAQVIIVFVVLFLGFICQTVFNAKRRDWIIAMSSVVVGLVLPMILESDFIA
jgi:hydrogenase/urease accessory protein HupE